MDDAGKKLNEEFVRLGITSKSIEQFKKPMK
jgi:hypothetical protein